jgi:hypothetical protein
LWPAGIEFFSPLKNCRGEKNSPWRWREQSDLKMIKMNKKGLELSIGFVVIFILSVLIFSLALYYLFEWFGKAEQLKAEIDRQTQEQIMTALKTGNQLVAIPISILETTRGKPVTFGVGVRNIASETQFSMATSYSGAYTPDGRPIIVDQQHIAERWLGSFATTSTFALKKNQEKLVPLLINADLQIAEGKPTSKGDYVFNICIYDAPLRSDGTPPAPCDSGQYSTNPDVFYTGKIYQVVVKIV